MLHGMRTASKAPNYSPLNSGLSGVDIELLENRGHVPEQRSRKEPDVVTGVEYITDEPAETDPADEEKRSWWRRNLSGWRGGLVVCIALAASVLAINIGFLIWAVLPSSSVKLDKKSGLGVLYRGDSDTMDELSRVIHLVVNVLGTLLLGASNYSLQIMLAPTRAEVDHAHRKRDWVDVGAQSLRNLKFIGRGRALVCAALAVSSLPLHLL
ncbi:hypothetical protein DIS24_g10097 [Lasiodiplodia hormozganensis]|uniref:DUF6536 domain-containing protein n=1 Tax=Lasiodiplodia hormozganensis TaxID=869390 RepID=A0AA39XQY6_9PEZI|nr:hypothetical protein DIS24_g10097 [Lasiodiplodia hormozganensis]